MVRQLCVAFKYSLQVVFKYYLQVMFSLMYVDLHSHMGLDLCVLCGYGLNFGLTVEIPLLGGVLQQGGPH